MLTLRRLAWGLVLLGLIAFLGFSWVIPILPAAMGGWITFAVGLLILMGLNARGLFRAWVRERSSDNIR